MYYIMVNGGIHVLRHGKWWGRLVIVSNRLIDTQLGEKENVNTSNREKMCYCLYLDNTRI